MANFLEELMRKGNLQHSTDPRDFEAESDYVNKNNYASTADLIYGGRGINGTKNFDDINRINAARNNTDYSIGPTPTNGSTANSTLSPFEQAFAKARKEQGPDGEFDFEGKPYNTRRLDDPEVSENAKNASIKSEEILSDGYSEQRPVDNILGPSAGNTPQAVSSPKEAEPSPVNSNPDKPQNNVTDSTEPSAINKPSGPVTLEGLANSPLVSMIQDIITNNPQGSFDQSQTAQVTVGLPQGYGDPIAPRANPHPDPYVAPFMPSEPQLPPYAPDNSQAFNEALEMEKEFGPDGLLQFYKSIMNDPNQQELAQAIEQLLHRNAALEDSFAAPRN